jgi:hypothetical protein
VIRRPSHKQLKALLVTRLIKCPFVELHPRNFSLQKFLHLGFFAKQLLVVGFLFSEDLAAKVFGINFDCLLFELLRLHL